MLEDEKIKVINFLQDFGCATLEQLELLFSEKGNNFRDILNSDIASKKGNIFVYNGHELDKKTIAALEILCKYRKRLKHYSKGFYPINISFLTNDNILYHIIVSDRNDAIGILKLLRQIPNSLPEADKYILLFEDESLFNEVECSKPYIYCTYPEIKIIRDKILN